MTSEIWWGLGAVAFVNIAFAALACFSDSARKRDLVFHVLDNAAANGYFAPGGVMHDASPDEMAYAMAKLHKDYQVHHLMPYVHKWLRKRGWVWTD